MARLYSLGISYITFLIYVISLSRTSTASDEERKIYIIYMGALPKRDYFPSAHHASMLREIVDSKYVGKTLIRSYNRSFNGFAAYLTNQEQQKLAAHDDVVSVFPSKTFHLHTTNSWDFMNFPQHVHRNLEVESDIIIGVIDTGIWPESKSFTDLGLSPVPKKWKGVCNGGKNFTCNNKIIGARYYVSGVDSARDLEGHGSHTASTAAGNNIENASFYGIAQGTARGGVPAARIAVYKVCSNMGCSEEDILASFDDAIADGVDIISISIGSEFGLQLQNDTIAIASFHALEKGVLTVHSAGNSGPVIASVSSTVPWLFTVAASTTNRKIISKVATPDGLTLAGNAINSFNMNGTKFPLIYGKNGSKTCEDVPSEQCDPGCLDKNLVQGKIVVCNSFGSTIFHEVNRAGGIGLISVSPEESSPVVPYAASELNLQEFELIERYFNSTKMPEANISASEAIEESHAPIVASFSSRGPNMIIPDILKPDISAPGVEILAAYSPAAPPSEEAADLDARSVEYSILSGTSMSCPHVTGGAAYVKSQHPMWSPSAIKSALMTTGKNNLDITSLANLSPSAIKSTLMTTAWRMNATNNISGDAEFSYGSGHLDPIKALNPGLVYETFMTDYVKMICGLNLSSSAVDKMFADNSTCSKVVPIKPKDLNYPTMTAQVGENTQFSVTFPRTVTNVGLPNSTYKATITNTSPCKISVEPNFLDFKALYETESFAVTVVGQNVTQMISASLEWFDGIYRVRSPIVVYT